MAQPLYPEALLKSNLRLAVSLALLVFTVGCAGLSKSCSQGWASNVAANWIIVQYAADGRPFHCWKVKGAAVDNSQGGNIDWKDPKTGHLMHVTGWENRVQVTGSDYASAGRLVGVDADQCEAGAYPARPSIAPIR